MASMCHGSLEVHRQQDACYDMESKPYQLVPKLQFVACTLAFFRSQLLYMVRQCGSVCPVEKAS
jgi:hypothetical protein